MENNNKKLLQDNVLDLSKENISTSGTASSNIKIMNKDEDETAANKPELLNRISTIEKRLKFVEGEHSSALSTTTDWIIDVEKELSKIQEFYKQKEIDREKKLIKRNIDILSEIGQLEENWNGYDAEKISQKVIFRCLSVINSLELSFQPEIFPTARDSIQLEYEPDDRHYLEIEIFSDTYSIVGRINGDSFNKELALDEKLFELIDDFHSQL